MLKALVVDDKPLIRKGVKSIIESAGTKFKKILECSNGKEAARIISEEKIHLVITDIRMPEMDGIQLMQMVNRKNSSPKFIVLSGYDDFQYARQSIDYGARSYLLKPLDRNELICAVEKVEKEILKEEEMMKRNMLFSTMEKKLREDKLRIALLDGCHTEESKLKLNELGLVFKNKYFYITLVAVKKEYACKGNNSAFSHDLKSEICKFLKRSEKPYLDLDMDKLYLVITDNVSCIYELMDHINHLKNHFFASVSEGCDNIMSIRKAYLQALNGLKYHYVLPEQDVIYYKSLDNINRKDSIPAKDIQKLGKIIGTDRINEFDTLVGAIFEKKTISLNSISYLEDIVRATYEAIADKVQSKSFRHIDEFNKYETLRDVYNFDSIKSYLSFLREFALLASSSIAAIKSTYYEKTEIDRAIDYIRKNYYKDIDLTVVSNHVSLNYSYFSHAFKEQTGMSFVKYLRSVRIDKAKELLKESQMKIYEVAEEVGFENHKHFSRAFRETIGISPLEYREESKIIKSINKIL